MASWSEWAFDTSQTVPAQLVSQDDRAIDDLVDGSFGRGTYKNGEVVDLNDLDVYPVKRIADAHEPQDIPNPEIVTYEPMDGGLIYQINQTFTSVVIPPPTLDQVKAVAFVVADANANAFLNGGFFFDDGDGSVLYNSDDITRSIYAQIGVEGAYIGNQFTVDIRDANSVSHSFDNNQWVGMYHEFFTHMQQAQAELEAANLAIIAATDEDEVQAALDAMSPANDTL